MGDEEWVVRDGVLCHGPNLPPNTAVMFDDFCLENEEGLRLDADERLVGGLRGRKKEVKRVTEYHYKDTGHGGGQSHFGPELRKLNGL